MVGATEKLGRTGTRYLEKCTCAAERVPTGSSARCAKQIPKRAMKLGDDSRRIPTMSKRKQKEQPGPYTHRNWRAFDAGDKPTETHEWPLFSDAWFTGEIRDLGPYSVLNAVALAPKGHARAALVLRGDLCVNERSDENSRAAYHGGHPPDEIAALLSLCTGARLKAGGQTRWFKEGGDPLGTPRGSLASWDWMLPERNVRLPRTVRGMSNPVRLSEGGYMDRLHTFSQLDPETAGALVKSARLYQDALWIGESEPHLAWLFLVSAVETAADQWRHKERTLVEHLADSKPELVELLRERGGDDLVEDVADQISNVIGATFKFSEFVLAFDPGPPEGERLLPVNWTKLKRAVKLVYGCRSKALHGGSPFPSPMCDAPFVNGDAPIAFGDARKGAISERPFGLAAGTGGAMWKNKETPMLLHVFEHITRGVLLRWWESKASPAVEAPAPHGPER